MTSSAEQRIEQALAVAKTPDQSPAITLHRVMTALGYDFGDPALVESDVMQFYADPGRNPFVQAQLEAKIILDAGHLENLGLIARAGTADAEGDLRASVAAVKAALDMGMIENPAFGGGLCKLIIVALCYGLRRYGASEFNDLFGAQIDRLAPKEE